MTCQTCALPGCHKPPWPSVPQGDSPALACGNLHHQLLMASRFNPAPPHPHQAILDRNAAGLCALISCDKPPWSGHSWCSRTHYLLWLSEFTSSLQPDQICMLPGCTRHVFVDDKRLASRFCGWRHEQKFVMLSSLPQRPQKPLLSVEVPQEQLPSLPASLNESEGGHLPSLNNRMHSLKQFALFGIVPKNTKVVEDFYEKHPWEVFTGGRASWLIVRLEFTSKGRRLTTKDHCHWKQSGPRVKKSKYTEKYYTYAKRKGKGKGADQERADISYTMKEYTMEDVKCYSLIHLLKEKPSPNGKVGKAQPCKQQIAEQVDDACSQDTMTSKRSLWNDDMSEDSIFGGLLPLDVTGVQIPVARA